MLIDDMLEMIIALVRLLQTVRAETRQSSLYFLYCPVEVRVLLLNLGAQSAEKQPDRNTSTSPSQVTSTNLM